jgi:hypothetical protein
MYNIYGSGNTITASSCIYSANHMVFFLVNVNGNYPYSCNIFRNWPTNTTLNSSTFTDARRYSNGYL